MTDALTGTASLHEYERATTASQSAFASARELLPTGVSRQTLVYEPYPIYAERGAGQYLWDLDGNRYLDFVNNYTSLIHGHAYPPSVQAAAAELGRGGALGAPTRLEREYVEFLRTRFPVAQQIRFALSGSEAVAYALRVARAVTGRRRIVKFEGGFHGSSDEMQQSISSPPMRPGEFGRGRPSSAGLIDVPTLVCVYNDRDSLRAAFAAHGEEIAAVIAEPFLGNSGLVTADPGFLSWCAAQARQHGALFILDEIQSMRLAAGGAQELHGVVPDIVALGKIIGGGLPLACFGASANVMSWLDGFSPAVPQTGTFNAFSASLAAGLAAMRGFGVAEVTRLGLLGELVRAEIAATFAEAGLPVWVNGWGSMFNITMTAEPVRTYQAWKGAPTEMWQGIRMRMLADGIYITLRGTGCLSTPMREDDVAQLMASLRAAIRHVSAAGS
jgi:glutamate-1-semialdehyde 2,1-aminomutase